MRHIWDDITGGLRTFRNALSGTFAATTPNIYIHIFIKTNKLPKIEPADWVGCAVILGIAQFGFQVQKLDAEPTTTTATTTTTITETLPDTLSSATCFEGLRSFLLLGFRHCWWPAAHVGSHSTAPIGTHWHPLATPLGGSLEAGSRSFTLYVPS